MTGRCERCGDTLLVWLDDRYCSAWCRESVEHPEAAAQHGSVSDPSLRSLSALLRFRFRHIWPSGGGGDAA